MDKTRSNVMAKRVSNMFTYRESNSSFKNFKSQFPNLKQISNFNILMIKTKRKKQMIWILVLIL